MTQVRLHASNYFSDHHNRCDRLSFMAWASSNQHLKFPNAEILTTKPEETDFSPDFLRRGGCFGFDL